MDRLSRRVFLAVACAAPIASGVRVIARDQLKESENTGAAIPDAFPQQDSAVVREIVGVSHGNLVRVKELVSARPALARAAWDWGYGDWETALGAASHVGNKEIAAVLLAAGAHPTIFSAAMLGQLEAVKAFVAASPGVQRIRGPHGLSILDHARAGKEDEVVKYLESLGDADTKYPSEPLGPGEPEALVGSYTFGTGSKDRLLVTVNSRGALGVTREGHGERVLWHHGKRVFNPAGAEAVRLKFEPPAGRAVVLSIIDGPVQLRATRV